MKNNSFTTVILLLEVIILLMLWLNNEYLASLATAILVVVCFGVWLVAIISERIERSKISKTFFSTIFLMAIVPILLAVFFYFINGEIKWE